MEEPGLHKLEATEGGGVRLEYAPGGVIQIMVEEMVKLLSDHKAPNYVEQILVHNVTGERWVLLVQRENGISPGRKAAMLAEENANMLRANRDSMDWYNQTKAEMDRFRKILEGIRDNWDCDEDAHRLGTPCRCCIATEALKQ